MKVPFSPPRVDQLILNEVSAALKSGWITTGPRTKLFEQKIEEYIGGGRAICLSSATAGLELVLRWFGIKEGDEVIIPAYTYCATANVIVHCGAKPVIVDVNKEDFLISVENIKNAITIHTKVIIPVDFGGMPCDYNNINELVNLPQIKKIFTPESKAQEELGRILVLADAAHSFGAILNGKISGLLTDISVFSFHAVKNLTTAEGGAVVFNLPSNFDADELYQYFNVICLHGQTKDAYSKTQKGGWKYDVIMPGYKANMTDVLASIGLIEVDRFKNDMLTRLRYIFERYTNALEQYDWAIIPVISANSKLSSFHIYSLRIKNFDETKRDLLIEKLTARSIVTNVHFIPLPMLSYYKSIGFDINCYPNSYRLYSQEISLPVYYNLTDRQVDYVVKNLSELVEEMLKL